MARRAIIAFRTICLLATLLPSSDVTHKDLSAYQPAFDFDITGDCNVLSAAGVAIPILFGYFPALRRNNARALVKIWVGLVDCDRRTGARQVFQSEQIIFENSGAFAFNAGRIFE